MRILFVHSIGKKKYGGGERWVTNAASGLHSKGHFVIVAGRRNSVLLKEAEKSGVPTYPISIYNDINIFQAFKLSRFIRKNKIDIVICKGRELVISGLAAKWAGNTLLIRRSGSPPPQRSKKLEIRTKRFVDGVITNTNTIREIYKKHGFTDENFVKVIYNGLTPDDDIPAYDFSVKYPGRYIVLSIGRAVGHKGYFYLIDALEKIKEKYPQVLVYVLGEGKDKEKLIEYAVQKGVKNMIHFAGYIHQVIPYIKGSDMFVHPSFYEGMPNAAMEAMAYGKPVIMTKVNGAEELSDNGKYAVLIPPKDVNAIVSSMTDLLENKEKYESMALKGKEFVRDNFGMDKMINSLEDFLQYHLKKKSIQK
ncbi:MAG: glycosyltransferase [Bacteroidota bacterium]